MLRRLKYTSLFAKDLSAQQIDGIVQVAAQSNARIGVSGVLLATGRVFFQIIEGPPPAIETLFARIRRDPRHHSVVVLRDESEVASRLFPNWSMRKIDLSGSAGVRLRPVIEILESIQELQRTSERLSRALELSIWRELAVE